MNLAGLILTLFRQVSSLFEMTGKRTGNREIRAESVIRQSPYRCLYDDVLKIFRFYSSKSTIGFSSYLRENGVEKSVVIFVLCLPLGAPFLAELVRTNEAFVWIGELNSWSSFC